MGKFSYRSAPQIVFVSDLNYSEAVISKGRLRFKKFYQVFRKELLHRFPDYKFGSQQGKQLPPSDVVKEKPWRPKTEKDLKYPPHKFQSKKDKPEE